MRWSLRRQMTCSEVLVVLQSYLDGESDAAEARKVLHHLRVCPPCEEERQLYAGIKTSLATHQHQIDPTIRSALSDYGQRLARGELG